MYARPLATWSLALLAGTSVLRADLLDDFAADPAIWKSGYNETLAQTSAKRFVPTSSAKDTLRSAKGGAILGLDAGETLIRFAGNQGAASAIEISLYNRGDQGDIDEKKFDTLLREANAAITKATGVKPTEIRRDRTSVVRSDGLVWAGKTATYRLEWSKNKDNARRPEFLKLHLYAPGKAAEILRVAAAGNTDPGAGYKAADHLKTESTGEKWLHDIPMVDQGQKGYCAVATTERVLRHYGLPIDQHQIAQIAGASAEKGTSYSSLEKSLEENASRLKVRLKILIALDSKFLAELAQDYNAQARKTKVAQLPDPRTRRAEFMSTFQFSKLDADTLVAGRKANSRGIKNFERQITWAIDRGYPVIWGVTLGIVEETPRLPQANGGHMRLIIGYNPKTRTITYSDSWGAGHERKTMPIGEAFAITTGLMTITP